MHGIKIFASVMTSLKSKLLDGSKSILIIIVIVILLVVITIIIVVLVLYLYPTTTEPPGYNDKTSDSDQGILGDLLLICDFWGQKTLIFQFSVCIFSSHIKLYLDT